MDNNKKTTKNKSPDKQRELAPRKVARLADSLLQQYPDVRSDRAFAQAMANIFRRHLLAPTRRPPGRPRMLEVDRAVALCQQGLKWPEVFRKLAISDSQARMRMRDAVRRRRKKRVQEGPTEELVR